MRQFFSSFSLDRISFWLGFLAATLTWWLVRALRPVVQRLWMQARENAATSRRGKTASTEIRYLNELLQIVQQQHLASPLFALDDVFIPVTLLKPPTPIEPGVPAEPGDITETFIPYLPDWPQMAAAFGVAGVGLADAQATGANIVLFARPGSGKTTCLAGLVSSLCRETSAASAAGHPIPVPLHVHDLKLPPADGVDSLGVITSALIPGFSPHLVRSLPGYLKSVFQSGRALLIIDGLDEATPDQTSAVVDLITSLQSAYPSAQFIAATSPENLTSLPSLGFVPLALSAWTDAQRIRLIEKWRTAWDRYIAPPETQTGAAQSDLVDAWLFTDRTPLTPVELSLKIWSAFAGDNLGPSGPDAIEAYLRRMTVGVPKGQLALQELAYQALFTNKPTFSQKEAQEWIFEFEAVTSATGQAASPKPGAVAEPITIPRVLPGLIESGLLVKRPDVRYSLLHPSLAAYLAARSIATTARAVPVASTAWSLPSHTFEYLASQKDLTEFLDPLVKADQQPLYGEILGAGRWLRLAREDAGWRTRLLRPLAQLAQDENQPVAVRARAVTALVSSGTSGIDTLLRQMLTATSPSTRQLAILAFGMLRDARAIEAIMHLLTDPLPVVFRPACFALVNIGTRPALEAVADCLLQGSEDLRRCAAEALANNVEEGHPTLREGATIDDLLVRKAVIHGLKRVGQKWAIDIIEKMRLEDSQWVVKNTATETLELIHQEKGFSLPPLHELTQTPWLIAFAGEKGIGVAPGRAATDLLLLALKDGKEEQKLAGMEIIRRRLDPQGVLPVYQIYYASQGEVREAAYNTLWHLSASGIILPPPAQFGLGYILKPAA